LADAFAIANEIMYAAYHLSYMSKMFDFVTHAHSHKHTHIF